MGNTTSAKNGASRQINHERMRHPVVGIAQALQAGVRD
jgi:hypothetical protein